MTLKRYRVCKAKQEGEEVKQAFEFDIHIKLETSLLRRSRLRRKLDTFSHIIIACLL